VNFITLYFLTFNASLQRVCKLQVASYNDATIQTPVYL